MPRKLRTANPRARHRREVLASRRVGSGRKSASGEARPQALINRKGRIICHELDRKGRRQSPWDGHHIFGIANSPVCLLVPVNDHRAVLSPAQYDWPRKTLKNRYGSPTLVHAAKIRGFGDLLIYLYEEHVLPAAEYLEQIDTRLSKKHGKRYWQKKMKLQSFDAKRK